MTRKKKKISIPVASGKAWRSEAGASYTTNARPASNKIELPFTQLTKPFSTNQCLATDLQLPLKRQAATDFPSGIEFEKDANQEVVSQYTLDLLEEIMKDSENPDIIITSTMRTPAGQAKAMYENIVAKGFQYNYNLYGAHGDRVVKVAEDAQKKGLRREKIIEAMEKEIWAMGPEKVSKHCGDPKKINVIDISPRSIANKDAFVREVKKRGIHMLMPPHDPAFHLEISQIEGQK